MAVEPRIPAERRNKDLLATYRQAQRTIVAQIKAAVADRDEVTAMRRRAQLASVVSTLDELGRETDPLAREIIGEAFDQSSEATAKEIARQGGAMRPAASFAGVQYEAVAALEDSILGRLADARATIGRQAGDVFATQQRRSVMLSLLGAQGSARSASKQLQASLVARGKTAFEDSLNRRWSLENYADMAVRTVTREAVTQGAIARMAAHGVNLARVSSHSSSCPVCAPWQGRLVSLDGSELNFEGEAASDLGSLPNGGPPFHPRCKHSLAPVVADLEATRRVGRPLPRASEATIKPSKLRDFAMDPQAKSPKGRDKAAQFRDRLDYHKKDWETVRSALLDALPSVNVETFKPGFKGDRNYNVPIVLTGPSGKRATVITIWKIGPNGHPELITIRNLKRA